MRYSFRSHASLPTCQTCRTFDSLPHKAIAIKELALNRDRNVFLNRDGKAASLSRHNRAVCRTLCMVMQVKNVLSLKRAQYKWYNQYNERMATNRPPHTHHTKTPHKSHTEHKLRKCAADNTRIQRPTIPLFTPQQAHKCMGVL